jgi:hypothetical protein
VTRGSVAAIKKENGVASGGSAHFRERVIDVDC